MHACTSGQERLGNSKEDDEGEREEPRAASSSAELLLEVLDDELVVRHVCDQSDERQGVHQGVVLVVDVKGEEAVDEEVGGVLGPLVAMGDTAGQEVANVGTGLREKQGVKLAGWGGGTCGR